MPFLWGIWESSVFPRDHLKRSGSSGTPCVKSVWNYSLDFTGCPVFQNVPPDLAICCFILVQSLSVRALQEMLSNTSVDEVRHETRGKMCLLCSVFFTRQLKLSCFVSLLHGPSPSHQPIGCWSRQMGIFGHSHLSFTKISMASTWFSCCHNCIPATFNNLVSCHVSMQNHH